MATWMISKYGSDYHFDNYLTKLISMELISSYCLTEPGSGSDAAALSTTAKKDGDYYILNGTKAFISGATLSDIYLTMVRTGDKSANGISCIIVDKNSEGLSFGKLETALPIPCPAPVTIAVFPLSSVEKSISISLYITPSFLPASQKTDIALSRCSVV